jgi:hypothetical protein
MVLVPQEIGLLRVPISLEFMLSLLKAMRESIEATLLVWESYLFSSRQVRMLIPSALRALRLSLSLLLMS